MRSVHYCSDKYFLTYVRRRSYPIYIVIIIIIIKIKDFRKILQNRLEKKIKGEKKY